MTPEMTVLAQRAVKAKGWRWMPGMAASTDSFGIHRFQHITKTQAECGRIHDSDGRATCTTDLRRSLPDLDDPATIGAATSVLGEDAYIALTANDDGSYTAQARNGRADLSLPVVESTAALARAAALVAALEAAP